MKLFGTRRTERKKKGNDQVGNAPLNTVDEVPEPLIYGERLRYRFVKIIAISIPRRSVNSNSFGSMSIPTRGVDFIVVCSFKKICMSKTK